MITIVTEGAVDPSFLTASDVQAMRYDIPVKSAKIDDLMNTLANKLGTDEKVPWANVDDPIEADAAAGLSGIVNVESVADSISQQGIPSIWIIKKLLTQTKASPNLKLNGKPLTSDVTYTTEDFNIYDEATVRAKFATPPTPPKAIVMGPAGPVGAGSYEVSDGFVLTSVYFDTATQTWSGIYRQVQVALQDGTLLTVPFS